MRAAALAHGTPITGQAPRVPVYVGLQTEEGYPHEGTLDFAGTGLDTGSGTLQLRAEIPNAQRVFLPGLFARLRIPLSKPTPRLMVPDRVVTNDQVGSYVLVVGPDHKVVQQRIEIGTLQDGLRAVHLRARARQRGGRRRAAERGSRQPRHPGRDPAHPAAGAPGLAS